MLGAWPAVRVNGKVLSRQEKQLVAMLDRPVMRMALRQGWMLSTAHSPTAGCCNAGLTLDST